MAATLTPMPPRHSVSVSGVIPDGLRREIREETGLDIEPDALTGVYKNMPRGIMEQWAFHVDPAAAPALTGSCRETGGRGSAAPG